MQVRRFKIVAGKHHAGNGVMYKQGDVLESTRKLDEIFRNKFVEVSDVTPVTAQPDPDGIPPPREVPTLTLATGAAVVLEKRLAGAAEKINSLEATIASQQNVINKQNEALIAAESIAMKLQQTERELAEAEKKIASLEKPTPKKTRPAAPATEEDPFKE